MGRLIQIIALISAFLPARSLYAQEKVGVRAGDHDGYSRLVFDWGRSVPYITQKPSPDILIVTFSTDAGLSALPGNDPALTFSDVKLISSTPLTISLRVPPSARIRDFDAGGRLVLDVYDPPGASKPVPPPKTPEKSPPEPSPKAPPKAETKNPPVKTQPLKTQKEIPPAPETAAPAPPAPVAAPAPEPDPAPPAETSLKEPAPPTAPENAPPPAAAAPPPPENPPELPISKATALTSTFIAIPSTREIPIAAFAWNKKFWIVNGDKAVPIRPQVSGPGAADFFPVEEEENPAAKIFLLPLPPRSRIRGDGGGLLWRFEVSQDEADEAKFVKPSMRGNRMLWPLLGARAVLDANDPVSGLPVKIVTVAQVGALAIPARQFVDFNLLPSPAGIAIVPKRDDLNVEITPEGVEISRPGGLSLSPEEDITLTLAQRKNPHIKKTAGDSTSFGTQRVYDFRNWTMGPIGALDKNKTLVLSVLKDLPEGDRIESLINLAKMYLSHGYLPEALGFLQFARDGMPDLADNPEFTALLGASYAMTGGHEDAFAIFSRESLQEFGEIGFWRAYVLAGLGDWTQAAASLPPDPSVMDSYTPVLFNRLAPVLAEVALRAGKTREADEILARLEEEEEPLNPGQKAALSYLEGEAARQKGKPDEAKALWTPLSEGPDELYRVKAGLALTLLKMEKKEITSKEAADHLERLRYAWRGDDLEVQILYNLGKVYFADGAYAKGLNIMRDAASLDYGDNKGEKITAEMKSLLRNLFLDKAVLAKISPLDMIGLYEQFTPLLPTGAEGDKIIHSLSERLIDADMFERASKILSERLLPHQSGLAAYKTSTRLAAINLLDNNAAGAMKHLDRAAAELSKLPADVQTPERLREVPLLRARAQAQLGRPDQAIAALGNLEPVPDVHRLRADIAWNAGYWDDAANALGEVILDRNLTLTRPPGDADAGLILNRAVALNLANDRIGLAEMREKYSDLMTQTPKAQAFEIVTRPRRSSALADRETLMNIVAETDLFEGFLKSYKEPDKAGK
ncbi:MAG: hypothetical protein K9G62_05420 [Alphaproteobacteria bacterium]|nr:hypothetical protein [Alphaproteobacteria bacterium]